MEILLNGLPRQVEEGSTVLDLLRAEGLHERRLAIEVNLDIIPRASHATHVLRERDRVEVVQAIGGG